jgi:hypothetical protein
MYDWDTYPLPSGTFTKFGPIEQVSYTAYKIDGSWYAHEKIHGPRGWAEPLVVIA